MISIARTSDVIVTPATKVWRYTSLESVLRTLKTSSLPFTPLSKFEDVYECYLPPSVEDLVVERFKERVRNFPPSHFDRLMVENFPDEQDYIRSYALSDHHSTRYISCWHMNEGDSAAMWDLYSGRSGIAIESTVGRLTKAIGNNLAEIRIGAVKYRPLEQFAEDLDALLDGMVKRSSFRHEAELRLRLTGQPLLESIDVPIDVVHLIERLHIGPKAEPWKAAIITDATRLFGYEGEILKSNLYTIE